MKNALKAGMFLIAVGYYVGCAPAKFDKEPTDCGSGCVSANGSNSFRYSVIPNAGKVDILFVDDNSGSMSTEQNAIASRFSTFINTLDSKQIDYRIGIVTTDISSANNGPRSINKNGALQDGHLVEFSSTFPSFSGTGNFYITPSTQNKLALFSNTIRRKETLDCESFLNSGGAATQSSSAYAAACPSPDERGIFAANSLIQNNYNSFLRSDAHLAVVFIGDEDERSSLYSQTSTYALADQDMPHTLKALVESRFPRKGFRMHSIIVKPGSLNMDPVAASQLIGQINAGGGVVQSSSPQLLFAGGDSGCLSMQSNQTNGVLGSYGYLYALASRMTGGVEGNICASDYGNQLATIGDNIGESFSQVTLRCSNPQPIDAQTPMVTMTPNNIPNAYNISGGTVYFNPNLVAGTQALLQYQCQE